MVAQLLDEVLALARLVGLLDGLLRRMTKAHTAWPVVSSVAPTTAASATFGCDTSADSISAVESRWPETFMTSSTRPSSQMLPFASYFAPSPAK